MVCGDFKDLLRRTVSGKVLHDKALLKIQIMMETREVLLQWFIIFMIKSLLVMFLKVKLCQTNN